MPMPMPTARAAGRYTGRIGALPVLLVFGVLGRQIVGGIMRGAVKG